MLRKRQTIEDIHIGFALTLACPNKCKHCLNSSSPENMKKFMSIGDAKLYASQFNELYANGIRHISFTGGEPLLAKKQLKILSDAAASSGIECGIVTSAHWAINKKNVEKIIKTFYNINSWELSVDIYHQEFVKKENIKTAYLEIKKSKKSAMIRFGNHRPIKNSDLALFDFINNFADKEDINFQTIYNMGRGEDISVSNPNFDIWDTPCPQFGLIINWDGSTSPCCSILGTRNDHPFQFGNAKNKPIIEIFNNFKCHPLRQIVRIIGFKEIIRWIDEYGKYDDIVDIIEQSTSLCYFCEQIFTDNQLSNYLLKRASKEKTKLKIALLASKFMKDNTMLQQLVNENINDRKSIDLAVSILENKF